MSAGNITCLCEEVLISSNNYKPGRKGAFPNVPVFDTEGYIHILNILMPEQGSNDPVTFGWENPDIQIESGSANKFIRSEP